MTAVGKQLLANFLRMAGPPHPAGTDAGAGTVAA
jgi:hypothetical protein